MEEEVETEADDDEDELELLDDVSEDVADEELWSCVQYGTEFDA